MRMWKKAKFQTKFIAHNGATNTKKVRKEIMHKLWTLSGTMRIYFYEIIFYYGKKILISARKWAIYSKYQTIKRD